MLNNAKIQKGNQIATFLKGWGGIIVSLIIAISTITLLYAQLNSNTSRIDQIEKADNTKFKEIKQHSDHEDDILEQRSKKQYDRGIKFGEKVIEHQRWQDAHIIDNIKDISYIKGYLKGQED